jgi:hypothetical protein
MEQINLSKKLTMLSSLRNVGTTQFATKLGNYLAKKEKVLYLTFTEYEEKIRFMASEMDSIVEDNFEVYAADEFCLETYLDILTLLEKNNYSTIIIDNLNSLYPEYRTMAGEFDTDINIQTIVDSLQFMIRQFKCRIILVYELDQMRIRSYNDYRAKLNDFRFPRSLVNNCNQIFFYNYPYLKGYTEDEEGKSLINHIELYSLKNENHKEELLILDNSLLNIFEPKILIR